MQFSGFWVAGDKTKVGVTPAVFDETELSEASKWKAAHQNEDPALPHGFVEWADAVADMERRLNGKIGYPIEPDL